MAREIRTRTTIETECISIIACRHAFSARCQRCGYETEVPTQEGTRQGLEVPRRALGSAGKLDWAKRARHGLVVSLKSLVSLLETKGRHPHS
jgi:hypothetical protein